jgi:hypothetical protein
VTTPIARNYSNTASVAQLVTDIGASDTTAYFTAGSYVGFPAAPFTAAFERGTAQEEIVLVTAAAPGSVTVVRAYGDTAAQSHAAGATFTHVVVAADYAEANAHATATTGVHGVTGAVVGTGGSQTLTSKTLAAPTLTGTTAGVNLALSGTLSAAATTLASATVTGTLAVTGATTLTGALAANGGATIPTGRKITLVDAPSAGTDGVNKTYADARETAAKTYADGLSTGDRAYTDGLWAAPPFARKVPKVHPSATAFPAAAGVVIGDTIFRTDLQAQFVATASNLWVQVSVPVFATDTDRSALVPGLIPEGFRIWHSGLKVDQVWDATASKWRFTLTGACSASGDTNGFVNIAHGAGQAPTHFGINQVNSGADAVTQQSKPVAWTSTATNLQFRSVTATGFMGSNPVSGYWWARF